MLPACSSSAAMRARARISRSRCRSASSSSLSCCRFAARSAASTSSLALASARWRARRACTSALSFLIAFFGRLATALSVGNWVRTQPSSPVAASAFVMKRERDGKSSSSLKPRSNRTGCDCFFFGGESGSILSITVRLPKCFASSSSSVSPTSWPRPQLSVAPSDSGMPTTSRVRKCDASFCKTTESASIRVSKHGRRPPHAPRSCC
mmetsp:Transcript_25531/g.59540  ORF Transcript_25531/g.59540 Transcript_25531/m.59540 type:complete len:208 (-) Transcript_25531:551-1174(-)